MLELHGARAIFYSHLKEAQESLCVFNFDFVLLLNAMCGCNNLTCALGFQNTVNISHQ